MYFKKGSISYNCPLYKLFHRYTENCFNSKFLVDENCLLGTPKSFLTDLKEKKKNLRNVQLTFELRRSTYRWIFFNKYLCSFFILYQFTTTYS